MANMEAKYKADIEALTESAEMALIEKEIAEEKLDACERELQELKDKLAEATLQIELLKKDHQENQSVAAGSNESTVTVYQLQKVEEQNEVLKQAIIKLRDISANDKKTLEDLQIIKEELEIKVLDLEERESGHLERIKIFEEQIDVSHNAQEMVEKLTQQKTDLEDKVKELVDDIDAMEKLHDLNEQLLESARETEIDLTGQIDKMRVQLSEMSNKNRDLEDYLIGQERTMMKFKEENRQLADQIAILRDQFKEGESIEQQKHQIENVAYKLNFSESKMAEKEAEISRYRRNLAEMEEQMNNLSLITKEQSVRIDDLTAKLEAKSLENTELQRALKKRMEEVSELEIRREMAEKKLQSIQRDGETKINNLNRTIETMKGIEIQHEEDIKRLMEDYEIIERERRELRDQLNKSNRSLERSMQPSNLSMSMMTAQDTSLASLGISFQTIPSSRVASSPMQSSPVKQTQTGATSTITGSQQAPIVQGQPSSLSPSGQRHHLPIASDMDDSVYMTRLEDLSNAFDQVNRKNYELEVELAMQQLNSHNPPYLTYNLSRYYDIDRAATLQTEMLKLKREIRMAIIKQQICPKSSKIFAQMRNDKFNNSKLAFKYQQLENEANAILSNSSLARAKAPQAPLLQSTPVTR